jgi:hypothetical protein
MLFLVLIIFAPLYLCGYSTSISSTNNHALLPAPALPAGILPKLAMCTLIYLALAGCTNSLIASLLLIVGLAMATG